MMSTLAALLLSLLILALAVVIGWRLLARRFYLPCPAALIWLLEIRIMENVAGSAALIERAKIERGMRVLDAGCGSGRVTIPVAEHVGPQGLVVALDLQKRMLERLAKRIGSRGLANVRMVRGALGQGLLRGEAFDRALLVTVLGEIPDRSAALEEIYRSLKPGGLLSVTEVLPDPHYQSRRKVRDLGERAGFEVHEVHSGRRSFTMNLVRRTGQPLEAAQAGRHEPTVDLAGKP